MLRIVDPQAQGTAPAGIPKFTFLQIVTSWIQVEKQLFAIRMSYFVAMTQLLAQKTQILTYLVIC